MKRNNIHPRYFILIAFVTAFAAMLGSLYFSEILRIPPCDLCWYQRIAMYPLVFMFGMIMMNEEWRVAKYAWPLVILGGGIAVWQVIIQYVPSLKDVSPCRMGISCSEISWSWGPFTIPLLSLLAFVLIAICLWLNRPEYVEEDLEETVSKTD